MFEICVAVKRAYIPASMYDGVCGELARLADAAVVDDGDKPGTQIGPVQNKMQYEKLKEFLADARANGNLKLWKLSSLRRWNPAAADACAALLNRKPIPLHRPSDSIPTAA